MIKRAERPRIPALIVLLMGMAGAAGVFGRDAGASDISDNPGKQRNAPFDGRPWNISTGNLSVQYIQASPMGAYPHPGFREPPPSAESLARLKSLGLVADEDYVGWGAVEPEEGHWAWEQHDAMERALHAAGLKYVAYTWVHFPPLWLRNQPKERTLMRCLEHQQEAFYLSIFDPRTIQWYDHFYKNLHDHFGNRIDDVYACILGPYGEGNYPLFVPDWVKMGHCHEGYWCGDDYGMAAFQIAMKRLYHDIAALNHAWGSDYRTFDDVRPPKELADEKFVPSPKAFPTSLDKRRWLDFITWYHQAIIDFAEQSLRTVLKYFPAEKVRMKPGGTGAGINPLFFGTYCPGYAKMAQPYRIVLQPADCQGVIFADKWAATAYQFYGVKECTEPAGDLDENNFVRRMFCDASCGAAQLFTYEFEMHASNMQRYVHLFTGKPGETQIAIYCPTTLYRLGGNLQPTITAAASLRDLCDFDVLDELLIADGALIVPRYRTLVLCQDAIIDSPILDKLEQFQRNGGKIISIGRRALEDVQGHPWSGALPITEVPARAPDKQWLLRLAEQLAGEQGCDGVLDGLWTCRRGKQVFVYNSQKHPVAAKIDGQAIEVAAHSIWFN
ncbi:MAG TPA: beta-galactosidase [Candidatus Saccharimonadales bacterium]|nr:beta-galactosidase [Candidatus Saccharimonadales bacterium]